MENWKKVVGFEGRYEVSDMGRVRSLNERAIRIWGIDGELIITANRNQDGYLHIPMRDGAHRHCRTIHSLVMAAFVGPRPSNGQCNHKDGNKSNNHLSNLEWVTPTQNMRHSVDVLGQRRGSRHVNAKLTEAKVVEIRSLCAAGIRQKEIARRFGVSNGLVSMLKNRLYWTHI